jgi:hypothetical protein
MLDATLIEAGVKPVREARSTPGQRSPHDADADWIKRGGSPAKRRKLRRSANASSSWGSDSVYHWSYPVSMDGVGLAVRLSVG